MQIAEEDAYIVRIAAINALSDLIRMFGIKTLTCDDGKKTKQSSSSENAEVSSFERSEWCVFFFFFARTFPGSGR